MNWKDSEWLKSYAQAVRIELPFFVVFLRLLSIACRRSGSQGLASAALRQPHFALAYSLPRLQ